MNLFGDIAKNFLGDGMVSEMIEGYIADHHEGGLQGVVDSLHGAGHGEMVATWLKAGANAPITAEVIHKLVGSEMVQKISATTGMPVEQILAVVADKLPEIISNAAQRGAVGAPKNAA